jgi:hypothetical protein
MLEFSVTGVKTHKTACPSLRAKRSNPGIREALLRAYADTVVEFGKDAAACLEIY